MSQINMRHLPHQHRVDESPAARAKRVQALKERARMMSDDGSALYIERACDSDEVAKSIGAAMNFKGTNR